MSWYDFKVITTTAALTMLVGLPLLLPAAVTAGPGDELVLVEQAPALEAAGCAVTAKLAKDKYEAGEPLEVIATVTSRTQEAAALPVHLTLMHQPYQSPMSRMMMPPMAAWEHDLMVELAPGEVKQIRLKTGFKAGDGATVNVVARAKADKDGFGVTLATASVGKVEAPFGLGGIKLELVAPEAPSGAQVAAPAPTADLGSIAQAQAKTQER